MNIDNDELRERIRSAMDVCPRENNCALDEARLNRVMALLAGQRQALRDEVMAVLPKTTGKCSGTDCFGCEMGRLESRIATIFDGKQ